MQVDILDVKHKRVRGPVFTILGTFVLVYSTALIVYFNNAFGYLILAASALATAVVADLGVRMKNSPFGVLLLAGSGALLALVALLVMVMFPDFMSAGYAFIIVVGSFVVLRGVHDVQDIRYLSRREDAAGRLVNS